MRRRQPEGRADLDLDATDELPVLDLAAAEAEEERLSATGEWPSLAAPVAAPAEPAAANPADEAIAALTSTLREKSFAIARLERELEAAHADAQRLRSAQPVDVAALQQRLAEVERERITLAAQHDERRAALAVAEEALATQRESLAAIEARLAGREADLAQATAGMAAADARAAASAAEAARLAAQLESRTRAAMHAEAQRDRERFEARIDALGAEIQAARAGHAILARDRDQWRAREAERAAEVRALREELRLAGLHAARLLEELRSREARRRYDADLREAGSAPRVAVGDARIAELEAQLRSQSMALESLRKGLVDPAPPLLPPPRTVLPKRYLVRLDDPSAPLRVLGQERISVGRTADNDLQIDENWMSRHHATLRLGAEATVVEDEGSTNGVFVNHRRVRRELLRDGDEIAFGKARFRFQVHRPGGSRD